ncbi:S1 family peptidase [Nonomuraea longispora]|uniref:S1 family peptidase n=2 Tax=Nonomuraea longispora TaxID=1848320 RepID=A0A4R4NA89_9ACTN|nr:S1 family peptidase [Nonomuraea longispora]
MRFVLFVMIFAALIMSPSAPAAAITNGVADGNAHPEVGALVAKKAHPDGSWAYCTGTLISPTVFLTAAHCAEPGQKTVRVTFADRYRPGSTYYTGRYVPDPRFEDESALHDMAVVLFDEPIPGIKPARLPSEGMLDRLEAEGDLQKASFTPVGYGSLNPTRKKRETRFNYPDTRHQATISFKDLSRRWLDLSLQSESDGSTCFGDSGGPNFLGGSESHLLVATSISGADDACTGTNYDYRLDTPSARDFLDDYVTLP